MAEPITCIRCRSTDVTRRFYRAGTIKSWAAVGTWQVCGGCNAPQDYRAFRGEVTPEIKLQVLRGEIDDSLKSFLKVVGDFRQLGMELGTWTADMDRKATRVEVDMKASLERLYEEG